jgi:hypothetical protein
MSKDTFNRKAFFAGGLAAASSVGAFVYMAGGSHDELAALDASIKGGWGALIALLIYSYMDEPIPAKQDPAALEPKDP